MCLFPPCGCASILVVDDQIINRMILNEFGKCYGVISDEAENGKIAYQKFKESQHRLCCGPYRLILMDLNMPVMTGIRSCEKILEVAGMFKPKIVAVTAFASEEEKQKCFLVGFDDFKTKPVDSNTYLSILSSMSK